MIAAGHFCSERGFSSVIQELAKQLVPCTRRLWQLTKVIFVANHDFRECAICLTRLSSFLPVTKQTPYFLLFDNVPRLVSVHTLLSCLN